MSPACTPSKRRADSGESGVIRGRLRNGKKVMVNNVNNTHKLIKKALMIVSMEAPPDIRKFDCDFVLGLSRER